MLCDPVRTNTNQGVSVAPSHYGGSKTVVSTLIQPYEPNRLETARHLIYRDEQSPFRCGSPPLNESIPRPMPRGVKKGVKRAFNNAKRELTPIIKAAVKQGVNAAKQELKASGGQLAIKGGKLLMKNMFGSGDYHTNSLIKGGINSTPSFGTSSSTFRRREPLGQIISSSTPGNFKLQKFRVNAGLASTFPWLAGFGNNYESWRPMSLIFEYVPTSGMSVASGDTALGSVTMAAQYNPFAQDPSSLLQIQGYPNSVTAAPFEHSLCGIECQPSKRQADTLLVRNGNVSGNGGLVLDNGYDTLFDLCEFFIATEGCQVASVKLGQLWVTYEIQLLNPIIPLVQNFNPGFTVQSGGGTNYPSTGIFSLPNSVSVTPWSGATQDYAMSANQFNFPDIPPGTYTIQLNLLYTSVVTQTNVALNWAGVTLAPGFNDFNSPQGGATSIANFSFTNNVTILASSRAAALIFTNLPTGTVDRFSFSIYRSPGSPAIGP